MSLKLKPSVCAALEQEIQALALGEAGAVAAERAKRHLDGCAGCRELFDRYREIGRSMASVRTRLALPPKALEASRRRLERKIEELKRRLISYRIFPSPLGHIMIGRSEHGVALLEYLHAGRSPRSSRASRIPGLELIEDGEEIESLRRDLGDYFEGTRTSFDWPLDLGLVRSEFNKKVLRAALKIPYGTVMSYAGLAKEVGKPRAVRAVAQALRWNPLPIVIPCHRVIGSSGSLTGYCGNKIFLKERLLNLEGISTRKSSNEIWIEARSENQKLREKST